MLDVTFHVLMSLLSGYCDQGKREMVLMCEDRRFLRHVLLRISCKKYNNICYSAHTNVILVFISRVAKQHYILLLLEGMHK